MLNKKLSKRGERAIDRFREAHYWLHQMEVYYHLSDPFRWSLNAFITTYISIPDLIEKSTEKNEEISLTIKTLKENPLRKNLKDYRNDIVHTEGLIINSKGEIGLYDGSKMRLGLKCPINPQHNSDEAILNYLKSGDILGILIPDEDNYPVVYREWKSSKFDSEILTVCREALMLSSEVIHQYAKIVFGSEYEFDKNPFTLENCCKPLKQVQYKKFKREELAKSICTHSV